MNIYKAHNKRKTLVHHCNEINKSIQIIMDNAVAVILMAYNALRPLKPVQELDNI